jgi:hypothetical protein
VTMSGRTSHGIHGGQTLAFIASPMVLRGSFMEGDNVIKLAKHRGDH